MNILYRWLAITCDCELCVPEKMHRRQISAHSLASGSSCWQEKGWFNMVLMDLKHTQAHNL